jgi:hypothetical protein
VELDCIGLGGGKLCGTVLYRFVGKLCGTGMYRFAGAKRCTRTE